MIATFTIGSSAVATFQKTTCQLSLRSSYENHASSLKLTLYNKKKPSLKLISAVTNINQTKPNTKTRIQFTAFIIIVVGLADVYTVTPPQTFLSMCK